MTRRGLLGRLLGADRVIVALCGLLCVYYFATHGIFQGKASGDGYLGFLYLPGLLFHRTFDLGAAAPEYIGILGREATGKVANPCPIGPLVFWAPPYLAGLGIRKIVGLLAAWPAMPRGLGAALRAWLPPGPLSAHGAYDYWMAGLGSLGAGLLGVGLLFRLLRRRLDLTASRVAVLASVLGTPLCWYIVTQPLYQHATSFFAVTLFVERWDAWRGRLSWGRAAALGAIAGYAMLVRVQEGIFLLLPALDVLRGVLGAVRARRPALALGWLARGALLLLVAALCFLPQLLVWKSFYGVLRAPQAPGHMRWASPALLEITWSTRAGLLPWTPLLYLALPGLLIGRRHLAGLALPLALVFAIEWYVNAAAWDYHGSWGFGPRRFTDATVVWAAGLGGLWAACRPRGRAVLAVLIALLVLWNGVLMELLRNRRIKNSAVGAFPAPQWVRWASGPAWLERWLGRVGYPFAWPAAWTYGAIYHMPATRFEGIVGNYLLERDWRVRGFVLNPGFSFAEAPSYVISGARPPPPGGWPPAAAVPAGPSLRLLIPLSAREPVRLRLSGDFAARAGEVEVRWNGERLPQRPGSGPGLVAAEVPERLARTRARLNELVFSKLPPGTRLQRLDFESFTEWWKSAEERRPRALPPRR